MQAFYSIYKTSCILRRIVEAHNSRITIHNILSQKWLRAKPRFTVFASLHSNFLISALPSGSDNVLRQPVETRRKAGISERLKIAQSKTLS